MNESITWVNGAKKMTCSSPKHLTYLYTPQKSLDFHHINFSPEPHILLFRRPLGTDPQSGRVDPELERKAREEYRSQYGRN